MPKPSLGDLSDLKSLSVRQRRENNPNVLGYNYDELVSLDTVDVELVPEKKGILLKHNEYHVSSKVRIKKYTINPVLRGTVLVGHPVSSGWLSKSPVCFPLITVIFLVFPLNPLTPRSDQHKTSPYNIHTFFSKLVMRIFKLIR